MPITALKIAQDFDRRATVQMGWLEGQMVFQVTVWGGTIGYIMPPQLGSSVWGINLFAGAHELCGYFTEETDPFDPDEGSELVYFSPL